MGLPGGHSRFRLHRNLILPLENQRFPDKTPNEPDHWQWVHCEVSAGQRGTDVRHRHSRTSPGEAVQAELENPKSNKVIRPLIGKCSAAGRSGRHPGRDQRGTGPGAVRDAADQLPRLDPAIQAEPQSGRSPWPWSSPRPTSARSRSENPDAFARGNCPGARRNSVESRLKNYRFLLLGRGGLGRQAGRS